jgi:Zn-dependent M28 family amino/carboxypeptidase
MNTALPTPLRFILPLALAAPLMAAAPAPDPLARAFEADMRFLADDLLEGRGLGQRGHEIAAQFVANRFARLGLQPAGIDGWFQRVNFAESRFASASETIDLALPGGTLTLANAHDMALSAGSVAGAETITAPLVFAGYGLQDKAQGIDDFAGLDVKGKLVVVLTGAPDALNTEIAAHLARSSKAMAAQAGGAIGLIQVRTLKEAARLPWDKFVKSARNPRRVLLGPDGKAMGDGAGLAVRATISDEAAARLFAAAGQDFAAVRDAAAKGPIKGFALAGTATIRRETAITRISSPNVLALLPGTDKRLANEVVLMEGHLDHVGIKADAKPGEDAIFNGAMDNAAGSTTLLQAAEALAKAPPKRSVLFMATTAEESGLLGAYYFAAQPSMPMARIVGVVNIDMPILTCDFGDVVAFGAERSTIGPLVAAAAKGLGLSLSPDPQPEEAIFTRSDHYPLVRAGVPSVFLKTGWKDAKGGMACKDAERTFRLNNYHEVSDQLDLPFDWAVAAKWTRLNIDILRRMANAPAKPLWYRGDYFGEAMAPDAPKATPPKSR